MKSNLFLFLTGFISTGLGICIAWFFAYIIGAVDYSVTVIGAGSGVLIGMFFAEKKGWFGKAGFDAVGRFAAVGLGLGAIAGSMSDLGGALTAMLGSFGAGLGALFGRWIDTRFEREPPISIR
ncbi:hypothetical protein BH20ACI2_BH20ACI2_00390 [soil metagenome]